MIKTWDSWDTLFSAKPMKFLGVAWSMSEYVRICQTVVGICQISSQTQLGGFGTYHWSYFWTSSWRPMRTPAALPRCRPSFAREGLSVCNGELAIAPGCTNGINGSHHCPDNFAMFELGIVYIYIESIPVVPHKPVAEVSKIGNL